jgi:serine phosphatase RsbU (regulator of sigma subunit)
MRAEAVRAPSPAAVLRRVNESLVNSVPEGLFCTIFYGVLDLDARRMTYASAGHPHPLRYRQAHVISIENYGMPLGLVSESEYDDVDVALDEGDTLVMFTDGLVEAHDPDGAMLGFEAIEQVVAKSAHSAGSAADVLNCTLEAFRAFTRGQAPEDDVTLVVLRLPQRHAPALTELPAANGQGQS